MMSDESDTIFALSSGLPPSAIAIIRITGKRASVGLTTLAGKLPPPRMASRRRLKAFHGSEIDDALVVWFPGPASATGEDLAEFHVHGSRAVLKASFAALGAIAGLRPAEPGEFTRRAFENGKIDLTQAEAIDDLIHADTDAQRRHALRQLDGLLGDRARRWRQAVIDAAALIEAGIDFSDEEDVPRDVLASACNAIRRLRNEISDVLDQPGAERLRDGLVVAITGPPNVGKSTLMNRLAGRDIAIVSPYAGTTRDVLEVSCDFGGYPVTILDTAGIRNSEDPIEQEGIRRARARADTADLRLWLMDDPAATTNDSHTGESWIVRTKSDLGGVSESSLNAFSLSALTGEGVAHLVAALANFAAKRLPLENAVIFRERHRRLLQDAATCLDAATTQSSVELIAEELRRATLALGRLLGRVDVDDVLDSIFRNFCIGK